MIYSETSRTSITVSFLLGREVKLNTLPLVEIFTKDKVAIY